MKATRELVARGYLRAGVVTAAALAPLGVFAQEGESNAMVTLLDSVDLSGVSTKIAALALVIVGIAFVMKGPSVAKRLISKI